MSYNQRSKTVPKDNVDGMAFKKKSFINRNTLIDSLFNCLLNKTN
jgi:hypothetical protein